ncbi:ABC transporter ATP-binding protein [Bacillus sp. S13(2024)]|uniref:ABC transporter ATP-binding protein n=1 Tax=unclassified Bacillus (in: firmicutes) TaxID=185979 RepID=UPI003D226331
MKKYILKKPIISLLTILLTIISSLATVYVALLLQEVIDLATKKDFNQFGTTIIVALIYFILLGVLKYLSTLFGKKMIQIITQSMRTDIFLGIMNKNTNEFAKVNSADYISLLSNDIKIVEENYLLPMLEILSNIAVFVGTLVLILKFSPIVAAYLFVALFVMFIVPSLIGKNMQTKQNELAAQYALFTKSIKDYFSGFEVIKSYNMNKFIKNKFLDENKELAQVKYNADKLLTLNATVSDVLATVSMLSVIFIGAYLVLIDNITVGTLVALIQLSSFFVNPIMIIMQSVPKIKSTKPILERIENNACIQNDNISGAPATYENEIIFNNVSFSYDSDSEKNILNNISLRFERGKKYAIVGPSGCGKTTLIKLLTGNYQNYSGDIFYDETSLKDLNKTSLNNLLSVLHQNVYLFDSSFHFNICLHNNYNMEKFREAILFSGLDGLIEEKNSDVHFLVGENGANLSGGQKQRTAFARSIIKNPQLLILDEGTSSLDIKTSRELESKLLALKDTTVISITHKIDESILNQYDEIIYIEKGSIIEHGSFSDLTVKQGSFYNFYNNQLDTIPEKVLVTN